jgi:stearoyl-CoA desaturase (delta-9 desaturase)
MSIAPETTKPSPDSPVKKGIPKPPRVDKQSRIMWPYVIGVAVFHAMIVLLFLPYSGPYLFSWWGLLWLPVGNFLFCSMGIGAGLHRLHTHRSFKCPLWLEHVLAVLGCCCLQDTPVRWVVVHRLHHQHSDLQPDPHTPMATWFWGHVGWLFIENREVTSAQTYDIYAKDMLKDPFYMKMERSFLYIWINIAQLVLFYLAGFVVGYLMSGGDLWRSVQVSVQWAFWGVFMRIVYTWNVTWGVNSFSHMFGYRNYDTRENSRNNWLIALATSGEGWHNNHHADPRSCAQGHRWWEVDFTYTTICLLSKVGLAWDIVPPTKSLLDRRAKSSAEAS